MDVRKLSSCQCKLNDVVHKSRERMINTKSKKEILCSATTNTCMTIPKQSGNVRTFTSMTLIDNNNKFRLLSNNKHYSSSLFGSALTSQFQLPSPSSLLSLPSLSHQQRYSFSSTSNTKLTYHNPKQSDSLNLIHLIPKQTLETIQTLPEVQQLLSIIHDQKTTTIHGMTTTNTILESIDRAIQIFQHVGIEEHKAMLVLKAMYLSQICHYQKCCHVLLTILNTYYSHENKDITTNQEKICILSSLVKMFWYNGSFTSGLEYANILDKMIKSSSSSTTDSLVSTSQEHNKIFETGCTMNAIALCKLLSTQTIKDVDILQLTTKIKQHDKKEFQEEYIHIQSMLEKASQMLENAYLELQQEHDNNNDNNDDLQIQLALSCASSYCNQGIVSLLLNMMNNKPNDSALNNWKHGLYILKELEQNQNIVMESSSSPNGHYVYLCKLIQARIYCNMTWSILFQPLYHHGIDNNNNNGKLQKPSPLKEEELKMASEYASLALKEHDDLIQLLSNQQNNNNQSNSNNQDLQVLMGRTLGLVASCYARAGSAVTAEGLLQSAMDTYKHPSLKDRKLNPLVQIDSRSASLYYSSLCRNWEKRDSDAKLYEQSALLINDGIICDNWRDISAIYSGLWLFIVSDFQ